MERERVRDLWREKVRDLWRESVSKPAERELDTCGERVRYLLRKS